MSRMVIRITDFGHPFVPSKERKPDLEAPLEDRPIGGFGLYFIYKTMDTVSYETAENGNCLKLEKRVQNVEEGIKRGK